MNNEKKTETQTEITGRIGMEPKVVRTATGREYLRLQVVQGDGKDAAWYTAKLWNNNPQEQPQPIPEALQKGATIKLAGVVREREYQGKDGSTMVGRELNNPEIEVLAPPREKGELIAARGRVARDPEVKQTPSGKEFAVVDFVDNSNPKSPRWHKSVHWEKDAADVAARVKKGQEIQVVGELAVRKFTGKDGVEKEGREIHGGKLEILKEHVKAPQRGRAAKADQELAR